MLKVEVDVYTLSFAFNVALTFENTSSNGIKSGLYGEEILIELQLL